MIEMAADTIPTGVSSTGASNKEIQAIEMGEAEAWGDLQRSSQGDYRAMLGIHVERIGGSVVLIAPGTPLLLFNRVIGLGVTEPVTEHLVKDIISCYRQHGVQQCLIHSNPIADQMGLPNILGREGIALIDAWAKMQRASTPRIAASGSLHVQQIQPQQAELFGKVACEGFGMPAIMAEGFGAAVGRTGWFHYLAFDGTTPVGTAAMFVRDGIAWLGIASTRPAYRRRGGQLALLARRINDAAGLGCGHLIAETRQHQPEQPNSSFHNMVRAGFRLAYLRRNYLLTISP